MDDPDVVMRVHIKADGLADDPVIRQRPGPQRIYFKPWGHNAGSLHAGSFADNRGTKSERGGECEYRGTHVDITFHKP
jgi:hypothetical protein